MVQFQKPKKVGVKGLQTLTFFILPYGRVLLNLMHSVACFFVVIYIFYQDYMSMSNLVLLLQIYNERRLFYGGGPGVAANDNFGSGSGTSSDRRSGRGRGM